MEGEQEDTHISYCTVDLAAVLVKITIFECHGSIRSYKVLQLMIILIRLTVNKEAELLPLSATVPETDFQ